MKFKYTIALVCLLIIPTQADDFLGFTSWVNALRAPDFRNVQNDQQRKKVFFNYLLPIIEAENKKILLLREFIKNNRLNPRQTEKLAKKYRLKNPTKQQLLNAIDIVPASLVLAQAAIESDWGRSRFAVRWHNYFGIWCFDLGCGVIPTKRDRHARHEIATFSSPSKATEYYLLNINRNSAYAILREIRQQKRNNRFPITGTELAEGLENYSQMGDKYIETTRAVIRQNQLKQYDYLLTN